MTKIFTEKKEHYANLVVAFQFWRPCLVYHHHQYNRSITLQLQYSVVVSERGNST